MMSGRKRRVGLERSHHRENDDDDAEEEGHRLCPVSPSARCRLVVGWNPTIATSLRIVPIVGT